MVLVYILQLEVEVEEMQALLVWRMVALVGLHLLEYGCLLMGEEEADLPAEEMVVLVEEAQAVCQEAMDISLVEVEDHNNPILEEEMVVCGVVEVEDQ